MSGAPSQRDGRCVKFFQYEAMLNLITTHIFMRHAHQMFRCNERQPNILVGDNDQKKPLFQSPQSN